ncbi:GntP family permease [Lewinella cohaerens]|uniref:GntP family permease n=1 Tax=Lewinella cohaerens TaxID=70995 RepID=UPI00037F0A24|nr:gluconate:H+ symporter [Lewinella cohaerens]
MTAQLFIAIFFSIALLLLLVLQFRLNAFLALLIASIGFGLSAGIPTTEIITNITTGMGGTLGFVATIVGLGAILGAVLEHSGGSQALARFLLSRLGEKRASLAFVLTGFLVAIPVFFDVAFVLLVPLVYALGRRTGRSLLHFGIPLLAGLATTHAFIPPTPGPIAVADILQAELGWVIMLGFAVGIPTVTVAGLWWGKRVGDKFFIAAPPLGGPELEDAQLPPIKLILTLILLPIILILGNTLTTMLTKADVLASTVLTDGIIFLGHPYVALLLSCLLALYYLGTKRGLDSKALQSLATKALAPAGAIILITGAGGVYKQMLVTSGAGASLAEVFLQFQLLPPLLAFILAALIRILQGSATVAMITAAGLLAPALPTLGLSPPQLALLVLSIAAGASTLSHVNDSGFWLVKEYLHMDEATTLRSWSMMTVLLSLTALVVIVVLYPMV